MLFIHNHNIIHRDLKPGNLFISDEHLVIGDFGLAVTSGASDFYGTPNYIAPELWNSGSSVKYFTCQTDLFAAGCILYEMCTLELAFPGDRRHAEKSIRSGQYKPIQQNYSQEIKNLIYQLLSNDPSSRGTTKYYSDYFDYLWKNWSEKKEQPISIYNTIPQSAQFNSAYNMQYSTGYNPSQMNVVQPQYSQPQYSQPQYSPQYSQPQYQSTSQPYSQYNPNYQYYQQSPIQNQPAYLPPSVPQIPIAPQIPNVHQIPAVSQIPVVSQIPNSRILPPTVVQNEIKPKSEPIEIIMNDHDELFIL